MYIMKKYDIENRVAINEGPSKRKLVKSLTKGSNVTFKLNGGRVLTGQINCLEREGDGFYFGGTFKDPTMTYEIEGYYNPKTNNNFVQINKAVRQDAPVRMHISAHTF